MDKHFRTVVVATTDIGVGSELLLRKAKLVSGAPRLATEDLTAVQSTDA